MTFKGHSRSLEMSRFDKAHKIFYDPILYRCPHIATSWIKLSRLDTVPERDRRINGQNFYINIARSHYWSSTKPWQNFTILWYSL